jgi:dihydropteroate synthase
VAARRCGLILMHTRGVPSEWKDLPPLPNPAALVLRELAIRAAAALETGIARDAIVLDPGFGFGKLGDENYSLLAHLDDLRSLGYPLLAGLSRKSFLARTLAASHADPDSATLAASVAAALAGAHIVRVHAVRPAVQALAIADAILRAQT